MTDAAGVRSGLVTTLQTVLDRVYDYPYAQPVPPMAHVSLDGLQYDAVYSGAADRYTFIVRLFVGNADQRTSVTALDAFLVSVPAAVNNDPSLAGSADSARVVEARNFGVYQIAEANLLGVEFVLDVIA